MLTIVALVPSASSSEASFRSTWFSHSTHIHIIVSQNRAEMNAIWNLANLERPPYTTWQITPLDAKRTGKLFSSARVSLTRGAAHVVLTLAFPAKRVTSSIFHSRWEHYLAMRERNTRTVIQLAEVIIA